MKLSIIVPIYNVEPYLRKCVDSLLAQDYDDYEIILVDDGSTDSCPAICDEYSTPYTIHHTPSIRVIHQENGGLSAARNTGIEAAQGEYICFVDSDDYWEPNVLGKLMAQIERDNLDVLRFDYQNVRLKSERIRELGNEGEYEVFHPNKAPKRDVDYSEIVVDGETFLNQRLGPSCYAVMFIIKRGLIYSGQDSGFSVQNSEVSDQYSEDTNILFTPGIYFEDVDWTPRMLLKAKRAASTSLMVYNYLWRTGSITQPDSIQKQQKVINDKISLIKGFYERQKLVQDPQWFIWMTSFTTMTILGYLTKMPTAYWKSYIKQLKALNIFPLSIKREKIRSHRLKIHIANLSPALYCTLMSFMSKIKH